VSPPELEWVRNNEVWLLMEKGGRVRAQCAPWQGEWSVMIRDSGDEPVILETRARAQMYAFGVIMGR
jgi:hypothetical protein